MSVCVYVCMYVRQSRSYRLTERRDFWHAYSYDTRKRHRLYHFYLNIYFWLCATSFQHRVPAGMMFQHRVPAGMMSSHDKV